jgi:hypothetical protein
MTRLIAWAATTLVAVGALVASNAAAASPSSHPRGDEVHQKLTASSTQLAARMPRARANVEVELRTDRVGFDKFEVHASGLPTKTAFTVFLL